MPVIHPVRLAAIAVAAAVTLALPATADAAYFIDRVEAQSLARDWGHKRYPGERTFAYCRPQGRTVARRGYIYHRWTCGVQFGGSGGCVAGVRIRGSADAGSYYARTLFDECD